jgi:hypothetical protein
VELGCEVRVLTTDANGLDRVLDVDRNEEVAFPERGVSGSLLSAPPAAFSLANFDVVVAHVKCGGRILSIAQEFITFRPFQLSLGLANGTTANLVSEGALQRREGSSRVGLKAVWDFLWYHVAGRAELMMHVTSEHENPETGNAHSGWYRKPGHISCLVSRSCGMAMIPNGVDVPVDLNREERSGVLRMLSIGRLDPKKGIEVLLQAAVSSIQHLDGVLRSRGGGHRTMSCNSKIESTCWD